jgi:hypothetical protein
LIRLTIPQRYFAARHSVATGTFTPSDDRGRERLDQRQHTVISLWKAAGQTHLAKTDIAGANTTIAISGNYEV